MPDNSNHLLSWGKRGPFPVTEAGKVHLEGNRLVCSSSTPLLNAVVELDQLQYVYLVISGQRKSLLLFDHHQHFVSCQISGFEAVFYQLVNLLGLDEERFFQTLAKNQDAKVEIWRAKHPNNCEIISPIQDLTRLRNELSEGFWVLSEPRQWISWDATSDELAGLPFAYAETNAYGLKEIRFHYPVQLGSLRLTDFRYYFPRNARSDVPLGHFYSNLRVNGNGDQNYFLPKEVLRKLLGPGTDFYERKDQNAYQWMLAGLRISLVYWYDAGPFYESGHAYLSVENQKEYPAYLANAEYENTITITKCIEITERLIIASHFRASAYFKKTPELIRKQLALACENFLVWTDHQNGIIGLANVQYAMILPAEKLVSWQVQNVLPGRGRGEAILKAIFENGSAQNIVSGACYAFDPYANPLSFLTQRPVTFLPPYEN